MAALRSSPAPADEDMINMRDDYLSPRSKVAKMLADIDDAPTPSPPSKRPSPAHKVSTRPAKPGPFLDYSDDDEAPVANPQHAQSTAPHSDAEQDADEDEDVRRPLGKAARRMMGIGGDETQQVAMDVQSEGSDDDLYSATPLRPASLKRRRELFERAASGSPLGSQSQRGTDLFVTPAKAGAAMSDDEDELPKNPLRLNGHQKLADLVAQKREERLAREAGERRVREERNEHGSSDLPDGDFESSHDAAANPDIDRILSDAARPTRKASKRALLEMERETQRMARQQALAHQMKTKKKFTTTDFFAKFNFRQPQQQSPQKQDSSSAQNSDGVEASPAVSVRREFVSTPPSSPPTPLDKQRMLVERGALAKLVPIRQDTLDSIAADDEELPNINEIMKSSARPQEPVNSSPISQKLEKGAKIARWSKKAVPQTYRDDDSDDDLDIVQPLPKHLQVFDRIEPKKKAENHSNAIHALRYLSHIGQSDAKPNRPGAVKPSVHPQVLEAQLRRRAREQAHVAQEERLTELKAKGIVVQSAEEREKEAEDFENLLEKAREEAQDLRRAEKAARKEAGGEANMNASDDESEDEDYAASGSEEEEGVENGHELVDDAAEDDEDEDEEETADAEALEDIEEGSELPHDQDVDVAPEPAVVGSSEAGKISRAPIVTRKARKSHVIQDDDEDSDASDEEVPATANVMSQGEDPFAAFGFGAADARMSVMSPTQAFNATMQTPTQEESQEEAFDMLRRIAPPSGISMPLTLPYGDANTQSNESQTQLVSGPAVPESQEIQLNWETQAPETPSLTRKVSGLSETPGWEPTQDPGLPSPWTAGRRNQLQREPTLDSVVEDEHGTQDTVQLRVSESPAAAAPKRGRFMNRKRIAADDSEDEDARPPVPTKIDAFREMKRRRIDGLGASDRAEAELELKRMMEDQAEESEDEYAGLGGDDTDQIAPENAEDIAMIDSSHIDVDERAIAAHYAERERVAEEEATKKLYKDLTTGALRRRAGNAEWDLDEDEGDVAIRRRQMRQREEAKKRRLLLQDDGVRDWMEKGKQTKGKDAFLRAIADDDVEVDNVIDIDEENVDDVGESQSQSQEQATQQEISTAPLQEISANKRRLDEETEDSQERSAPKLRRTKEADVAFSRPTSMLQVRESLSFLLDEPSQADLAPPTLADDFSDDDFSDGPLEAEDGLLPSDDEEVDLEASRHNDGGFAPDSKAIQDKVLMPPPRLPASERRTPAKPAVVDRLSLKRGGSSSSSDLSSRSAWSTSGSAATKAPSLLRRATTNMTNSGANDRGVSIGGASKAGNDRGVTVGAGARNGGSSKSSFAAQARAEERKAIVEASARRRAENTAKIAQLRRANSGSMARMGGGGFE